MFVEEEVFFETSNFEYIVYQIIGNFHDPQSVSDLPMNLKAEDSENEDREKAEEKSQNYLASNPERDFFQGAEPFGLDDARSDSELYAKCVHPIEKQADSIR